MNQEAAAFISTLLGKQLTAKYEYSVFNCTTNSVLSHVYEVEDGATKYLVKLGVDGGVLELYKTGYQDYEWAAVDKANPDNVLEVYKLSADGKSLVKYDLNGNALVTTYLGKYMDMPIELRRIVYMSSFNHKTTVWAWAEKSYGLIVEYKE